MPVHLTRNPNINYKPPLKRKIEILVDLKKLWALWRETKDKQGKKLIMKRINKNKIKLEKLLSDFPKLNNPQ